MSMCVTRRRFIVMMGAAAVLLPGSCLGGKKMVTEKDVRVLSQLEGTIYKTVRDELFRRGGDFSNLAKRHAPDPDWRVRITAEILQGWATHRSLFGKVIAEINGIDLAGRRATVTGITGIWEEYEMRAHIEYGPSILPLAWEQVFKFAGTEPAWRTATFLAMMAGVPVAASVEPAAHVIENSSEQLLRERAALTLTKLPRDVVDLRLAGLSARSGGIADAVRTARELME